MPDPDAAFYFDLASPLAYLAAERVLHVLPVRAEWQPVLARELPGASAEALRAATRRHSAPRSPRARELGPAAAALARPVPVRQRAGDARRDVRQVDRPGRSLRAGGLPPGVRRWTLARGPRPRADRRRGLRDAPGRGAEGGRAALRRARNWRLPLRARRRPGSSDVPASDRASECSSASAPSRRRRRTRARRRRRAAMKANRAYRLIVTRGGRTPALLADAGGSTTSRSSRSTAARSSSSGTGPRTPPRGWRERCAPTFQLEAEEFLARWGTVED